MDGIQEIQKKGNYLSKEHLTKIKQLIDSYDEHVQELSIKLYINIINNNSNLLNDEIDYILSRIKHFERIVREKFIEFLIDIFNKNPNYENKIIIGFIGCLKDEFWNIRIRIIEFFNNIIDKRSEFFRDFDEELKILLEEEDLDVKWEILEFLFKHIIGTYSPDNIKDLINSINKSNWVVQENIIFLVSKIGIKESNLIKPITKDIVLFLDHDDFLVNQAIFNAIKEIIEYHVDLFDEAFFFYLKDENFDNLEAIENLLKFSINKHGFLRFYYLFTTVTILDIQIMVNLTNIVKKLYLENPKFVESLFSQLGKITLEKIDMNIYTKMRMFLKAVPKYHIYLDIYHTVNQLKKFEDFEADSLRKELVAFLSEMIPELDYVNLSEWLSLELRKREIHVDEICSKYNIHRSKIMDILLMLLNKRMIEANISDNIVMPIKQIKKIKDDLLFQKQWKYIHRAKHFESVIKLYIQIKNISTDKIIDLQIILDYPKDLFIKGRSDSEMINIPKILNPGQNFILNWNFLKHFNENSGVFSRRLTVIALYKKLNKIFTIKKELEILLV